MGGGLGLVNSRCVCALYIYYGSVSKSRAYKLLREGMADLSKSHRKGGKEREKKRLMSGRIDEMRIG